VEVWQEALKIALIGTERQAPTSLASAEPLSRLAAEWKPEEKERNLLRASGLLTAYRRAGFRPVQSGESLPLPAEADEKPVVPGVLMQDLMAMVGGQYREALPEWLQLTSEQGWRFPEEHLVELLDFGHGHPELRAALLPLLGMRGRWLAAQNPDWHYALQFSLFEIENEWESEAATEEAENVWQTGTKEERVALLHRLRRSDPSRARALVESTWKQDVPAERAEFTATFIAGLSMEDEPFLETALDDKRKEVRTAAQDLLARLPESRFCQRMWERLRPLVQLQTSEAVAPQQEGQGGLWNRFRALVTPKSVASSDKIIVVALPQLCDKAMIRDGIEAKSPVSGVDEKTWWLRQMLERIPLALWSREWQRPPAAIVAANRSEEWSRTLLDTWTRALRQDRDPEWAAALFAVWCEQIPNSMPSDIVWKETLPPDIFEAGLLHLLEQNADPAFILLVEYDRGWSMSLARAVIDKLNAFTGNRAYLAGRLSACTPFIPTELQGEFFALLAKLAENNTYVQGMIDRNVALEAFRNEMRRKRDVAA